MKKCWNNLKTKRKAEITAHKQAILRTGGGPVVPNLLDDPEIDEFANIAREIPNAIDSDTRVAGNITCSVASNGLLEFNIPLSDNNSSGKHLVDQ